VCEPVEDGFSECGVGEQFVPGVYGELRGDHGGASVDAIFEDFQEVGGLVAQEGRETKVVDNQDVDASEGGQDAGIASVGPCRCEVVEEA